MNSTQLRIALGTALLLIGGVIAVLAMTRTGEGGDPADPPVPPPSTTTTTTRPTTSTTPASDDQEGWPSEVEGRPPVFGDRGTPPGDDLDTDPGIYLWSDFDGWHLWVVQSPDDPLVEGRIRSEGAFVRADPEGERGAQVTVEHDIVTFVLGSDGARVSGISFNPAFFTPSLVVEVDDDGRLPRRLGFGGASTDGPVIALTR